MALNIDFLLMRSQKKRGKKWSVKENTSISADLVESVQLQLQIPKVWEQYSRCTPIYSTPGESLAKQKCMVKIIWKTVEFYAHFKLDQETFAEQV